MKAWLSLKTNVDPEDDIEQLKDDAKDYMPEYPVIKRMDRPKSGNLFEISLFDHHFGRLVWGEETDGANYDVSTSRKMGIDSVAYMLRRAAEVNVDKILLPIGNDFFNVDRLEQTTSRGTPQSEDERWKKTFTAGRKLWIEIIEMCLRVAPVEVKIIPGNHDEERSFYLGDALECWFDHADEVTIDNTPTGRKYVEWGKCLIGFTHGDKEVKGSLINIMATERPLEWSRTKYREWHKGHLHMAKATAFQVLDEERGVREWILPSLVATDDWHYGKGYSTLRESMGMIWNKDNGKTDIFMYHPGE